MLMLGVVGGWDAVGKHDLGCGGYWWTSLSSESVLAACCVNHHAGCSLIQGLTCDSREGAVVVILSLGQLGA